MAIEYPKGWFHDFNAWTCFCCFLKQFSFKRRFRVQTLSVSVYIFFHEPDETFQSVLCPSFLSYSSVAAVCVFRTAWECNQGVWSLSFFWVSFLFLFWLWNETLCLVTPFVSHLGGFYTDTQLIFPILFFFLSNYYSSHNTLHIIIIS